jgi:hypothetical protein
MVRTQVQLEERQYSALKAKAAAEGVSIAELIRRGVEMVLEASPSPEERISRAIGAAGRFRSGLRDLSAGHDRYLGEALE